MWYLPRFEGTSEDFRPFKWIRNPREGIYARVGERVGEGGDKAYVDFTYLRSDCSTCASEGCGHCLLIARKDASVITELPGALQ